MAARLSTKPSIFTICAASPDGSGNAPAVLILSYRDRLADGAAGRASRRHAFVPLTRVKLEIIACLAADGLRIWTLRLSTGQDLWRELGLEVDGDHAIRLPQW